MKNCTNFSWRIQEASFTIRKHMPYLQKHLSWKLNHLDTIQLNYWFEDVYEDKV